MCVCVRERDSNFALWERGKAVNREAERKERVSVHKKQRERESKKRCGDVGKKVLW